MNTAVLSALALLIVSVLAGLAGDKSTLRPEEAILIRFFLLREGLTPDEIEKSLRLSGQQAVGGLTKTYSLPKDRKVIVDYKFDYQDKLGLQSASLRHGETVIMEVPAEKLRPTRAAFMNELFDARPTKVTPKFDGYTQGSYRFDKLSLLKELVIERRIRKADLRAAIILGPTPPLRTYDVTIFFREGEKIRANALLFAHERIRGKATALITSDQLKKLVNGISENGIAKKGLPKNKEGQFTDYGYLLLVATWSADGKEMNILFGDWESLLDKKKLDKFGNLFDDVREHLKRTYPEKDE